MTRLTRALVAAALALALHVHPSAASEPHAPSVAGKTYLRAAGGVQAVRDRLWRSLGTREWLCLDQLWQHESGWRVNAGTPSGSFGIPQAYPGSRMRSAGADWRTSAATQARWGMAYIGGRYRTPCRAWAFWQRWHWY